MSAFLSSFVYLSCLCVCVFIIICIFIMFVCLRFCHHLYIYHVCVSAFLSSFVYLSCLCVCVFIIICIFIMFVCLRFYHHLYIYHVCVCMCVRNVSVQDNKLLYIYIYIYCLVVFFNANQPTNNDKHITTLFRILAKQHLLRHILLQLQYN